MENFDREINYQSQNGGGETTPPGFIGRTTNLEGNNLFPRKNRTFDRNQSCPSEIIRAGLRDVCGSSNFGDDPNFNSAHGPSNQMWHPNNFPANFDNSQGGMNNFDSHRFDAPTVVGRHFSPHTLPQVSQQHRYYPEEIPMSRHQSQEQFQTQPYFHPEVQLQQTQSRFVPYGGYLENSQQMGGVREVPLMQSNPRTFVQSTQSSNSSLYSQQDFDFQPPKVNSYSDLIKVAQQSQGQGQGQVQGQLSRYAPQSAMQQRRQQEHYYEENHLQIRDYDNTQQQQQQQQQQRQQQNTPPPEIRVYMVHFKRRIEAYLPIPALIHHTFNITDFVIVSAEPFGEDIGVIVEIISMDEHISRQLQDGSHDTKIDNKILRMASLSERQKLPQKLINEENARKTCQHFATNVLKLPVMDCFDAEYTLDGHKLILYYNSEFRVDFRQLVKIMNSRYKTKVWMKKMSQEPIFYPIRFAEFQLHTGTIINNPYA